MTQRTVPHPIGVGVQLIALGPPTPDEFAYFLLLGIRG